MTYRGRVKDGVIVVEGPGRPPEGAELSMRVVKPRREGSHKPDKNEPSFYDRIKPLVGCLTDLPADLSENHDHYLCGCPKRTTSRSGK